MKSVANKALNIVQRGFTLVELLIVVIILAILAAIIIPQFSTATDDAKLAAMDTNLNALRSAIELYRVQHNGKYPGAVAATGATCTVGAAGAGLINAAPAVIEQLTTYTSVLGSSCTAKNASATAVDNTILGPYLRKGFPTEPIYNSAAIAMQTTGAPLAPAAATGGWAYDTVSGQIVVNSNATDTNGVVYSAH